MPIEDGGDPETDPGLDRTYELLVDHINDYLDREEEDDDEQDGGSEP